ncbi:MAG: hypothetical protein ACU85E_08880 [Gammaproteobacteria bacterium]
MAISRKVIIFDVKSLPYEFVDAPSVAALAPDVAYG